MSMVRLQVGSIVPDEAEFSGEIPSTLERRALLVYAGTFQSMDGQVEVQDEHIERLAGNHNTLLKRLMTGLAGDLPVKFCPPIQLDHSLSAKDTVGRLMGLVEVGEHSDDGQVKKALYGKVKIMGRENVEKVLDGRWTHLSIGADLDEGKFQEVTITPFPAAANASMLRTGKVKLGKMKDLENQLWELNEDIDDSEVEPGTATEYFNKIKIKAKELLKQYPNLYREDEPYKSEYESFKKTLEMVARSNGFNSNLSKFSQFEKIPLQQWEQELKNLLGISGTEMYKKYSTKVIRGYYNNDMTPEEAFKVLKHHDEQGTPYNKYPSSKFSQAEYRSLFEKTVNSVPGVRPTKVDVSESGAMAYYGDEERAKTAAAALKKTDGLASVEVKPEADNIWVVECKFKEVDGVKLAKGNVVRKINEAGWKISIYMERSGGFSWEAIDPDGGDIDSGGIIYKSISDTEADAMDAVHEHNKVYKKKMSKGDSMFEKLKAYMVRFMKMSAEDADKKLAEMPEDDKAKLMTEAEANQAKRDRMKGYLMAEKKMDDESAEKHLTEVSQEDLKKLEAEVDEHEKLAAKKEDTEELSEEDKEKAKLRAEATEKFTQLTSGIGTRMASIKLAAKEGKITARLSSLKASMKITPAEIKKVDVKRLASQNDVTIEAVLKSYEMREPVIMTGLFGTKNAVNVAELEKVKMSKQMEKDIMSSMPFTSRLRKATLQEGEQEGSPDKVEIHVDTDPHTDLMGEYDEVCKMMDEGKYDEAKAKLKKRYMASVPSYGAAMSEDVSSSHERMSLLEQELVKLHNEYEEMIKLTAAMRD